MAGSRIPEISVVILCYRSGDFAKIFHQKVVNLLKKNKLNYEIILVGNYRPNLSDTTPQVLEQIAKKSKRTKVTIKKKTNPKHTMGWDMRCGLRKATGKVIAIIDGDGQISPNDIIKLYKLWKRGNYDLCKTKRVSRGDGFYRKFISVMFNNIMFVLFPGITKDINGKPKIMTNEAYKKLHLRSNDWFIDAEIMLKARKHKFKIAEMETKFMKNPKRQSFVSLQANVEFLVNILKWRFRI